MHARYDYIINNLRLKQAAGTLSPADLEALEQYLLVLLVKYIQELTLSIHTDHLTVVYSWALDLPHTEHKQFVNPRSTLDISLVKVSCIQLVLSSHLLMI